MWHLNSLLHSTLSHRPGQTIRCNLFGALAFEILIRANVRRRVPNGGRKLGRGRCGRDPRELKYWDHKLLVMIQQISVCFHAKEGTLECSGRMSEMSIKGGTRSTSRGNHGTVLRRTMLSEGCHLSFSPTTYVKGKHCHVLWTFKTYNAPNRYRNSSKTQSSDEANNLRS